MKNAKPLTVVIKLGTSSIVDEQTHEPILSILSLIVETAVKLRKDGHRVVIVSSGAIGVGLRRMDIEKRPRHLPQVQALAAIGQCRLLRLWDSLFDHLRQPVAQVLLTRNDIAERTQYLNAQNTFTELLDMGVIPIVNENDTVAVTEIKFGDNDTLSAITAAMVNADYLFLMTDVDCLYTANPRTNPDALPIEVVTDPSSLAIDVSSAGSALGTGGMSTKLVAARLATSAGVTTVITRSSKPGNVHEIVSYLQALKADSTVILSEDRSTTPTSKPPLHTRFLPAAARIRDRSFWLLHGLAPHGTVFIDGGAHRALRRRAGLLPAGVVAVEGPFAQQEAVRLVVVTRDGGASGRRSPSPGSSAAPSVPGTPGFVALTNGGLGAYEGACEIPGGGATAPAEARPEAPLVAATRVAALTSGGLGGYEGACQVPGGAPKPATDRAPASPAPTSSRPVTPHRSVHSRTGSVAAAGPLPEGREVGRALVNYSSAELARIKGLQSGDIERVLGYAESEYVALRENVSLLDGTDVGKGA